MKEYITTILGIIISVLVIAMVLFFLIKRRKKRPLKDATVNQPPQP